MGSLFIYLYMVAAILFVLGIKRLSKVRTARSGNLVASVGMLLAIIGVLVEAHAINWWLLVIGLAIGGAIGYLAATRVAMTAMPEMVAAFNGFGGGASALVAIAILIEAATANRFRGLADVSTMLGASVPAGIIIGTATLTGSGIAYLKLAGKKANHPLSGSLRTQVHIAIAILLVAIGAWVGLTGSTTGAIIAMVLLVLLSAVAGVFMVTPIGGADMPVVVSLLNAFSGVAAAASGFVVANQMLIVAGALVGASGLILTMIMCKAMNRSLANVLIGGLGDDNVAADARDYKNIKSTSGEEVAMLFDGAASCIIVPGYGLAVAQAQHACAELAKLLEKRGIDVRYAIHPVAGRMPGHMNVLLAEADVPYDKLWEMDRINPDFQNTDVVIILGANDVVNPIARQPTGSPIAGMPILDVDHARTVVMVKRSLSPGYAGIKNPLFENDNTLMLFADAKEALQSIIAEVKEL
ncbi:MAG: NAD(P)(+) transhydrogenase (Re/Si-specific) subunit beta [Planctomycetes bacterium]|nr:NAD(P)(+) transhydrogenase (Re/Si-specific) subunit beta [Planctomycetota bacterium]